MTFDAHNMKTKATTIILCIGLALCLCTQTSAQQTAKTITDGHQTITYTSLLDAKKKIIEYSSQLRREIFEDGRDDLLYLYRPSFPMTMLVDLLRKEPLSNHFEFGFDEITEIASPDLKIKCYILKAANMTAAGDYEGAIVISNGSGHEVISIYDGPDYVLYTGYVRYIDCFTSTDGKTVYAVEQHDGKTDLFILDGTKLLPMKLAVDYDRINSIQKP